MVFPVRKVLESVHGLQRITMQRFQSSSLVIYENTQLISYYSSHETFLPSFRFEDTEIRLEIRGLTTSHARRCLLRVRNYRVTRLNFYQGSK